MIIHTFQKPRIQQLVLLGFGITVVIYALIVLIYVSSSYEIGLRSILSPEVVGEPRNAKPDRGPLIQAADRIVRVGDLPI